MPYLPVWDQKVAAVEVESADEIFLQDLILKIMTDISTRHLPYGDRLDEEEGVDDLARGMEWWLR